MRCEVHQALRLIQQASHSFSPGVATPQVWQVPFGGNNMLIRERSHRMAGFIAHPPRAAKPALPDFGGVPPWLQGISFS